MKKADIITIAAVFLISLGFYLFYIFNYRVSEKVEVLVYHRNQLVYKTEWDEDIDLVLAIGSSDHLTEEHIEEHGIEKVITVDEDIVNVIHITGSEIRMMEANSKNKYCMSMRITRKVSTAIVCTNGVVVKLSSSSFGGIIVGGIIWLK